MHGISKLADDLYSIFTQEKSMEGDNNWIVVGSNSTGKTMLIRNVLDLVFANHNQMIYYIDPQNRTIINQEVEAGYSQQLSELSSFEILANRRLDNNFTKQDVFNTQISGGALAFAELVKRFDIYKDTLEKFLQKNIECKAPEIVSEDFLNKIVESKQRVQIYINETQEIAKLSNSEAAKMRLVMEIMLAQEKGCYTIIIDEFDSHFDNVTMVEFMKQITDEFPHILFLFVIHNFESLVNIWNMKAVLFNMECTPGTYEHIIDTNDISEIGDAYRAFNKYMGRKRETEILLSDCLAYHMANDTLAEPLLVEFQKLDRKQLNKREKIIFDYLFNSYGE